MPRLKLFLAICYISMSAAPVRSDVLGDLAADCMQAVQTQDEAAFDRLSSAIMKRKDIFNTPSRELAEECLSLGFKEPWEYNYPAGQFMSSASSEARLKAAADARSQKAQDAARRVAEEARQEAERKANAARVATLVYVSCSTLLARDEVAAMTNALCVDSFLANGLPVQPNP